MSVLRTNRFQRFVNKMIKLFVYRDQVSNKFYNVFE